MCGRLLTDPERNAAFHRLSRKEKHVALEWVRDHEGPAFDAAMAYLGRLQIQLPDQKGRSMSWSDGDHGPYETPEQARAAMHPIASMFDPDDAQSGVVHRAKEALLLDACQRMGVELGAYDRRLIDWLIGMTDWAETAVFAGLIERAHEAGRQEGGTS